MKILTRYILKEMVGPTFLGFVFYTSIILMRQLFDFAGMIIKRSLPAPMVGKLLLLSLPHIVVLTVPMSLLFGILIAIGRLSSDSEIIAMRALGVSTRTIYRPVFLFSFAIFLSTAEKEIKPRVFYDDFDNVMIYVDDVDPRTGKWKGVFVADSRADESLDSPQPQKLVENAAAARDR